MIKLNLLPDIKRDFLKAKRDQARVVSFSILSIMIAGGISVALAVWVYAVQQVHMNLLTQNIKDNVAEVQKVTDINKYVTIQNQLANLSSLHDGKNDFSRLLVILPILNPRSPNSIQLTSVDLDDDQHTIALQGQTADFTGLVTFRDILENADVTYRANIDATESIKENLFSNVAITEQGMSKSSGGKTIVSFRISVTYNESAFKNSSRDVSVTVPKLETTPSKQDSPSLFTADTTEDDGTLEGNN